jgi:hypothetical protein
MQHWCFQTDANTYSVRWSFMQHWCFQIDENIRCSSMQRRCLLWQRICMSFSPESVGSQTPIILPTKLTQAAWLAFPFYEIIKLNCQVVPRHQLNANCHSYLSTAGNLEQYCNSLFV